MNRKTTTQAWRQFGAYLIPERYPSHLIPLVLHFACGFSAYGALMADISILLGHIMAREAEFSFFISFLYIQSSWGKSIA
jgi:hypothetical protein